MRRMLAVRSLRFYERSSIAMYGYEFCTSLAPLPPRGGFDDRITLFRLFTRASATDVKESPEISLTRTDGLGLSRWLAKGVSVW